MVSRSTIERKIMSTKTSIKRIALVAAAALTLGGFSVITATSAHAADASLDITGISFQSASSFASTTASTTPGTVALPVAVTVVANGTIYMDVVETGTVNLYQASLSTFADSATVANGATAGATTFGYVQSGTVRASGSDTVTSLVAPQTAGTYYLQVSNGAFAGTGVKGYVVATVVNALATTYDGNIWGTAGAGTGSASVSAVAGASNTVTLKVARHNAGGKAGFLAVSGSGATLSTIGGVASAVGALTGLVPAATSETTQDVVVNTPTAGTVTVTYAAETAAGSGIAGSVSSTITITVNATGSSGVLSVANSTFYDTTTISNSIAASASLTAATGVATASNTPVVEYSVTTKDVLTAAYAATSTSKLTAVVTGPGLLSATYNSSASAAKSVSFSSGSSNNFYLYGDGTSGVATITVSLGSTTIATKTLTFYSTTVAKLAATVNHSIVNKAAVTGFRADTGTAGTVSYVSVVATDSSGNAIPSLTNLTASSSSTSIATVGTPTWDSTDLVYYVPVSGVASGSATITVKDSSATISATAAITVAKAVITTMTVAFGAATYNAGDAATLTITAKDADGNAVADGYYLSALAAAASLSQALTSTLFGTELHFVNGVATAKFFAPYNAGVLTANIYAGGSATVLGSALQLEASGVAHTATAAITNSAAGGDNASLAYDAASAATDAANNAYEEAQNATQAASDALAAVKALAVQVKALIALVNKIKAKIGA
jgi:hypothetical protein